MENLGSKYHQKRKSYSGEINVNKEKLFIIFSEIERKC